MNRSLRLLGVVAGLGAAAIARVGAQATASNPTPPDFTGTWVLDTARSHRDGVLNSMTVTVARSGDTLSVLSEGLNAVGSFSTRMRYGLDGKAWTNSLNGVTLSTTLSWEGPTMIVTSRGDANGNKLNIDDRWSLDSARRTLTRLSSLSVNGQGRSETLVFTKR